MSHFNIVWPHVFLPSTTAAGSSPDDVTLAFKKYNQHEHSRTTVADFRAYPFHIDDPIYIYDEFGQDIFDEVTPARITYITGDTIRVDKSAQKTINAACLYYKQPRNISGSKVLFNVKTSEDSQLITFDTPTQTEDYQILEGPGLPGFISQPQLESLLSFNKCYNLVHPTASNIDYLDVSITHPFNVVSAGFMSVGFSGTAQLELYDPNNGDHTSTVSTWDDYGPALSISNNAHIFVDFMPKQETLSATYPTNRPTQPIQPGQRLALRFSSSWVGSCNLTLNCIKVI